jgi:hypothetical protein
MRRKCDREPSEHPVDKPVQLGPAVRCGLSNRSDIHRGECFTAPPKGEKCLTRTKE